MSERGVFVIRDGRLIPKHLAPPLHPRHAVSAYIIGDSLDSVMNPADGKRYDSKHKYYEAVRAAGCEIVGNEKPSAYVAPRAEMPDPVHDVKEAIEKVEAKAARASRKRRAKA